MISIQRIEEELFEVVVTGRIPNAHRVNVRKSDLVKLAGDSRPAEELLRAAFSFLLEREPNTSILREFDLMIISQYFPSFEKEMRNLFQT